MTAEQDAAVYFYHNVGLESPDVLAIKTANAYFYENVGIEQDQLTSKGSYKYFYENVETEVNPYIVIPMARLMHFPGGDFERSVLNRWSGVSHRPVALRRYGMDWRVLNTQQFDYTGAFQTFVVPSDITVLAVDAYGAEGASKGSRVRCDVPVTPGETLRVYVGDYPAGGNSDIRRTPYDLADRLVIAGGNGGSNLGTGINQLIVTGSHSGYGRVFVHWPTLNWTSVVSDWVP